MLAPFEFKSVHSSYIRSWIFLLPHKKSFILILCKYAFNFLYSYNFSTLFIYLHILYISWLSNRLPIEVKESILNSSLSRADILHVSSTWLSSCTLVLSHWHTLLDLSVLLHLPVSTLSRYDINLSLVKETLR